ncbi:MAG: DUF2066 domain-containing protein [bacterium]
MIFIYSAYRHHIKAVSWPLIYLAFAFICLNSTPALASPSNLYQAQVLVSSQSANERKTRLITGLKQVLVKKTGQRNILNSPEIGRILRRAQSLLVSFSYEKINEQLWLNISFDKKGIDQAINELGQAVWIGERHGVLVWILQRDGIHINPVTSEDQEYAKQIQTLSKQRAIPLYLPLMDLSEQQKVDLRAAWGGFTETLEQLATEYELPYTLLLRIRPQQDGFLGQWSLIGTQNPKRWSSTATDIKTLIDQGVENALDQISSEHVIRLDLRQSDTIQISVAGLYDRIIYQAAVKELIDQELIESVYPAYLSRDHVVFNLKINGPAQAILSLLLASSHFSQAPIDNSNFNQPEQATQLIYATEQ